MTRAIRHFIFCTMLVCICLGLTVYAAALRVGEVVDHVLATDIDAFINGYRIPSYNIGGRLGVVSEDLRQYGFSVEWNQENRTLSIARDSGRQISPIEVEDGEVAAIGTRVADVLYTDIVTYLDGRQVDSFNIGGRTIIYFSELSAYGTYLYDNDIRASMISYDFLEFVRKTILNVLPSRIIHAGGEIDGYLGSNSLEALNSSYDKGYRFIEMDFVLSSDGKPVCIHNWSQYYSNQLGSNPVSAEEFANVKIFNAYTSVTLDSLAAWLYEHGDAYIITDIKEDNLNVLRHIADEHPEIVKRIMPQIYQYDEYRYVRAMGYSNIILTLYCLPTYEEKANAAFNAEFADKNGLFAVTADATLATPEFVNEFVSRGVALYVHTVNDKVEQQKYFDLGVTGIYTDYAE